MHGLLAHDAAGGDEDRPGIVHRLDRDTSGPARRRALRRGARAPAGADPPAGRSSGATSRSSRGRRARARGRIEAPIGRDRIDKSRHSLDTPTPRDAVTRFEVVELLGPRALLESSSRPAARTRSASTWRRSSCRSAATRSTASAATSGSSASSCTRPGSRSTTRSPASASTSSRRCPRTSPRRSSAPAPQPDRSYTGRRRIPSVPATRTGGGACALSASGSARAPPACTAINRERGQSLGSRIHA